MRRLAILIALLLLVASAAPLLACATEQPMAPQESACCRAMHGHCEGMARMGCCRTAVSTDEHPQLATAPPQAHVQLAFVARLPLALGEPRSSIPSLLAPASGAHAPPGLILERTTILRI